MAEGEGGGGIRELLAVFGFKVDDHELKKGEAGIAHFVETAKRAGEAFIAAFAVKEIFEFGESQVKAAHAIERTAVALGLSTEQVQKFQYAAKAMGEDGDALTNMMGRLQVTAVKNQDAFHSLGINVNDASGKTKSAEDLFLDTSDAIASMTDPAKAAAAATQLFGRQGRQLLPILRRGREEAKELFHRYEELGGGIPKEAIKRAEEFEHAQADLDLTSTQLKTTIGSFLIPILTKILAWGAKAAHWFSEVSKKSNILKAAMITLGSIATVFAIKMAIANAPLLLTAAAIGAIILAVDELITLFRGGDTLIGRLIDKIGGKGTSAKIVQEIKDAWIEVKKVFEDWLPSLKTVWEFMEKIGGYAEKYLKFVSKVYSAGADVAARAVNFVKTGGDTSALTGGTPIEEFFEQNPTVMAPPEMYGPGYPGANSPVTNNITVNPAPGMDEKKLAEHTANEISKHTKHERRQAAAQLQRASAQ